MDKAIKISIIAGILLIALSITYYLVIFSPQKEKAKNIQQKANVDNLAKCLDDEKQKKNKTMESFAEMKRDGKSIDLALTFEKVEKDYQDGKTDCFKKYPQ